MFKWLLKLLYVRKCTFCRKVLNDESFGMCGDCRRKIPFTVGKQTKVKVDFLDRCIAPLYYKDDVRKAILRYKFHSYRGTGIYHETFSQLMIECIRREYSHKFDVITWVPISDRRKSERGFDQSELLAEDIGRALGIPVMRLLNKVTDNKPNSSIKDDAERRANVLDVYNAVNTEIITGKCVLLIDDVVTTGATLAECAKELLMNGAEDIFGAAIAKARK